MSARALAAAVGAALVFGAGWVANGWRLDGQHAAELAQRDRQALAVAEQVMAIGRAANAAISTADAKAWKGLEDDKKELHRLRGCVADGTCGVRLIAVQSGHGPSDPGAGSVGHDTVELDPDVQRRVLVHREAIGEDARKLEYLQAYALQCWRATNGEHGPSR
ncbi:hypothetical protein FYM52_02490 [Comamonas sp. CAH-2]|jgi:hypothetical protein|uniref:lysis system i-spanin subunit Rz n=1 Tax=Comamonas sp. CAH-2 TaxID=2605745 RepID=UPI0012AE4FF8|nr:lysis system i-spanin subunit Rz [Comamonas sp. CAH-2]MRT19231.1 hypothetical protein [Comamonas sp. CAH-2]